MFYLILICVDEEKSLEFGYEQNPSTDFFLRHRSVVLLKREQLSRPNLKKNCFCPFEMEPPDWPNRTSGAKFNCCLFICLLYFNDLGFILNGDGKGKNWLRGAIKLSIFHLH